MATLVVGDSGIDMGSVTAKQFSVGGLNIGHLYWSGTIVSQGSTFENIDIGGGYIEHLTGFGVTYNSSGAPLSGTLTGYQETLNGVPTFTVTGMNVAATDFYDWSVHSDTYKAFSTIFSGDDQIKGGASNDSLLAYEGHDYVAGGPGADSISGGPGNDHLYGQSANGGPDGADLILGDEGDDYIQGNAGNDTLQGGAGQDRIVGGADNDLISGEAGDDSINGNLGNDTIDAGTGNDYIRGGQGDDSITGGDGNDVILGDLGNDTITGGNGLDMMTGGAGNDVFKFGHGLSHGDASFATTGAFAYFTDVITDFTPGSDKLSLGFVPTAILSGTAGSAADAVSVAQSLLKGHLDQAVAVQVGKDTYVFWNGFGNATDADSAVDLQGVSASQLSRSDFV